MSGRFFARGLQLALCVLLFLIAAGVCATLWVIARTSAYIYAPGPSVPVAPVAMVLGASISSDGTLSPVLQERADTALALYKAHTVNKILVTGDNSSLLHDEVYPVGKYLMSRGVPQKDIFLDYAGFDTYSSMYRARAVFGVSSLIIVSQRFHLPRAVYLARALGLSAWGVNAAAPGERYFENAVREIPATVKALFDLELGRVPKYLGPRFSIEGDGSATWVGGAQMIYFTHDR